MHVWPQYLTIGLSLFNIGYFVSKKDVADNLAYACALAFQYWILYEGGFFTVLGFAP